jgi:hypothetical protein
VFDGSLLANTADTFYNDTAAEHNVEYCYNVTAVYDLGESASTDEECAMWEILAPSDLTADGLDGYVHLEWTDPPDGGEPGVGDECIGYDYNYNEVIGIVDCIGQCIDELYLMWLGDGLCDDGSWGVYFNCDEFNWDEGDCDDYANGDTNDDYAYRTEDQLGDLPPFEPIENELTNPSSRDLVAFNLYRDGEYLTQVEAGIYEYDDYDVENLTEYCYTITSVYEVGESEESDIACAIPIPGVAPSSLYAYGEAGAITWLEPPTHSNVIAPASP